MADTPIICSYHGKEYTITAHLNGRFIPLDKNKICPASPCGIRHKFGVMTGFIALFIIASVAYDIASRIAKKRSHRRELDRRNELNQKGFGTPDYKAPENLDKRLSPGMYEEAGRQAEDMLWFTEQIPTQRGGTNVLIRNMNGIERH